MSVSERIRRVPPVGWALLFAVALLLPGLGAFGFWDPWELALADRAREMARSGRLFDPTVNGRYGAEPALDLFLSALGIKLFGARELGARIGVALSGVLAITATYWAAAGLFRRRAGLLAALVLGTMPLFFLQGRQLVSDMPLVAGLALSLGGLGRFAHPATGRRRALDLVIAAAGLTLGALSGGVLLGVALPCLALTGALLVAGRGIPAGARPVLAAVAVAGVGTLVAAMVGANVEGRFSLLLGGVPRGGQSPHLFDHFVRQIGFGIFPWSALVVFALGRGLARLADADEPPAADDANGPARARLAFAHAYVLVFAAFGFALATVFVLRTGDARFPALAALAVALGAFLDEALEADRPEPVLGLLAAVGTVVVARDISLAPEELVSSHLLAKVKWPPTLSIGLGVLAVGALVGGFVWAGLGARGRALGKGPAPELGQTPARGPWLQRHGKWMDPLVLFAGRWGVQIALSTAVLFAFVVVYGLVPALSRHHSFKPVFESFERYAKPGDEIARYRVDAQGASFYRSETMVDVPTQDRLVEFLRRDKRVFALVPADELAALDAAFKTAQAPYFVLDASSTRFLLLSNRLGQGDQDRNPLKRNVWTAPNPPVAETAPGASQPTYRWSEGVNPPWTWRIPTSVTFEDAFELVGVDFQPTLRRPDKIRLAFTFRVNRRPPPGYRIFVHFDAPGQPRLIGDHAPLGGVFPTSYWLPGEYIRDEHEIDVPLLTQPAGVYTLFMGFWPGGEGKRLRITNGPNDGSDRARLGTIDIR